MGRHARRTADQADGARVAAAGEPEDATAGSAGDLSTDRAFADARMPWTRMLVASTARAALLAVVVLALWGAAPALLGWTTTTVMTGSMEPRISIGDVVAAKPVDPSAVVAGQIILFDDPDHADRLRLHRLIDFDAAGLAVTRGDANPDPDSTHVDPATIHGVGVIRVPAVGLPIVWLHEGRYLNLALLGAGLIGLALLSRLDRGLFSSGGAHDRHDDTPDDTDRAATDLNDELRELVRREGTRHAAVPVGTGMATALRRFGVATVLAALGFTAAAAAPAAAAYKGNAANAASTLSAAPFYTCAAAQLADNPYLFWKLDETAQGTGATAADASPNGRSGVYGAGATPTTGSICDAGRAATFNGSTQYVSPTSATSIAGPNTFTLEAWIRTSTIRGGKIIGFGNSATANSTQHDRHLYMTDSGTVVFGVYPGSVKTITTPKALNDNVWHHLTATLSTAGMKLSVDGVQVAADLAVTTAEAYNGFWRIGGDTSTGWVNSPTSNFFAGSIDNAAVYPTALSAAQIAAHYAARRT